MQVPLGILMHKFPFPIVETKLAVDVQADIGKIYMREGRSARPWLLGSGCSWVLYIICVV